MLENERAIKDKQLLETPTMISLQFALQLIPQYCNNAAIEIEIPHSLRNNNAEICLFVKDKDKSRVKELLRQTPVDGVTKVMSLSSMRRKFSRFADKRKLCDAYDLFMADSSILALLGKPVGKVRDECSTIERCSTFTGKRSNPCPWTLKQKTLWRASSVQETRRTCF